MQTPTLEVRNLSKDFGSVKAVNDLSFTVHPGSVTGFLGPNGAGKSTTLRILLGLVNATSGQALIGGKPYSKLSDPLMLVGAHLDVHSFHPGRTGRDHMKVACAAAGLSPERIDPLLELVSMTDAANRRMGGYSMGMQQRLGLATALLGNPSVLVLDEPANGLDPEGIRWLRGFLLDFASKGKSVLLSSHLLSEIQQMAQDVVIINHGKLVKAGTVSELEKLQGGVVTVSSTASEALGSALTAAHFDFGLINGGFAVRGTTSEDIGQLALAAGIPLTHLSEETTGLEDLFIGLVGDAQ